MTGSGMKAAEHPDYRAVLKSIPPAERRGFMQLTNRHGLIEAWPASRPYPAACDDQWSG